jgi:hypothetical protein
MNVLFHFCFLNKIGQTEHGLTFVFVCTAIKVLIFFSIQRIVAYKIC